MLDVSVMFDTTDLTSLHECDSVIATTTSHEIGIGEVT